MSCNTGVAHGSLGLKPPDSSESDMDSEASTGEWPNWDKDSIASEISNVEDCNMLL